MQLNPKHFNAVLADFLSSWNIDRIRNMSIAEYADLADHDSLCYWLEYGTKELGAIGAISLNKFELWRPRIQKDFRDSRFNQQGGYAWNAQKGGNLGEAFATVRQLIVDIVTNSQQRNWQVIDAIKFHAIGKWKISFLFSDKQLLPVYSMRALLAISKGLGYTFTGKDPVSELQRAIISQKPLPEDIVDFSYRVYTQFARKSNTKGTNYFIVGSKYEETVIDRFIKHKCIAIGWMDWVDFGPLMGAASGEVNAFVEKNYKEDKPPVGKIAGYFRVFSQISAGDIIAVKSQGSFGILKIIAYAQVVEREGSIYFHDDELLGHHIHVEFLDAGFVKEVSQNYAATIHKLTPEKDKNAFYDIFGWYGESESQTDQPSIDEIPEDNSDNDVETAEPEEGYNEKIETGFERSQAATVFVNRVHNRIQNRFMVYLNTTFPNDKCSGEKQYIDAKRISGDVMHMYEIKPFASPYACVREGIGQLLDYRFQDNSKKEKRLIIVGPNEPAAKDLRFINEIRTILTVPFSYLAFDEKTFTVKEF
jgi:hypothetical protein